MTENWFNNCDSHNSRIAKYWAVKEIADRLVFDIFNWKIDDDIILAYTDATKNYVIQLLKKEWFR